MASPSFFQGYDLFVISPETKEIIPYHLKDPDSTFQVIISDLQKRGKLSNIIYYNGLQSVPISPTNRVKDFLPSRQSQITFWAQSSVINLPISQIDPNLTFLQVISPDYRLYPIQVSNDTTINDVINALQNTYQIQVSINILAWQERRELRYEEKISNLLPRRTNQILFLAEDISSFLTQYSYLNNLPYVPLMTVLKELQVIDIIKLCQSSAMLASFCQENQLWNYLVRRDLQVTSKPNDITWKQYYYQEIAKRSNWVLKDGARRGDLGLVRSALYFGATRYNEAMWAAGAGGHREIIEILLERGATDYNETMATAAYKRKPEIVEMMLNLGADDYEESIREATKEGYEEILLMLLEHRAAKYNQDLKLATEGGQQELMDLSCYDNLTAEWASRYGHQKMVEKCSVYQDYLIIRLMALAARGGHSEIVKMMLERENGYSMMHKDHILAMIGAARGEHLEIMQMILDHEINKYGSTIKSRIESTMSSAAEGGYQKVVEMMLDLGAGILTIDDYNFSMHGAAESGRQKIVKMMLDRGANDYNGVMAMASGNMCKEIVQMMLELGANNYSEALVAAARNGDQKIMKMMLDRGANYDEAIQLAENNYPLGTVNILRQLQQQAQQ